jgi:MFS family permease
MYSGPAEMTGDVTPRRPRLVTGAFVAVTAATLAFFVYVGMLLVSVPRYVENELGAGEFGVGMTVASFAAAAIAVRPLIGWSADRFGRRRMMMVGAAIAAVAGGSLGLTDALWQVLVLRAFTGVGEAALFVGGASLIADLAPAHRRAEAASYFSVAVFGGIGIGPAIAETLTGEDRYGLTFIAAGAVAVVAALLVIAIPGRVDTRRMRGPMSLVLIHRAALWPGLVLASGIAAYTAFAAFLPEYSREVGLGGAAALFAAYSVVSLVLRLTAATLPERLGVARTVTFALVTLGIGLVIAASVPSGGGLWIATLVVAAGMAFLYPSLMAIVANAVDDDERARAMASFTMFFEAGAVVGGLMLSGVGQVWGKRSGFVVGTVMAVIGLVVLWTRVVGASATIPVDDIEDAPAPLGAA